MRKQSHTTRFNLTYNCLTKNCVFRDGRHIDVLSKTLSWRNTLQMHQQFSQICKILAKSISLVDVIEKKKKKNTKIKNSLQGKTNHVTWKLEKWRIILKKINYVLVTSRSHYYHKQLKRESVLKIRNSKSWDIHCTGP